MCLSYWRFKCSMFQFLSEFGQQEMSEDLPTLLYVAVQNQTPKGLITQLIKYSYMVTHGPEHTHS